MNSQTPHSSSSLFHGSLVTTNRTIYTPSSFARKSLLYLQETGSLKATTPHTSRRSHLQSFLFFIVRSGSGTLQYQGRSQQLHAGDCVFIDCNYGYSHTTSKNLWELQWVHFYGITLKEIYEKYQERGGASIFHPVQLTSFIAVLDDLYLLAETDDYIRDMRINENLATLLSLIMEQSWHPEHSIKHSEKSEVAEHIKSILDARYMQKVSLADLAKETDYNKYYMLRLFKKQYGITIGNYIQQLRISEAKRLLRFTDHSIEQIGEETGFPDSNYFARAFKKVEGTSPSTYRKSW